VSATPQLVDLRDAGVPQPAQRLPFELEAPQVDGRRVPRRDHLSGDDAPRVGLFGAIHSAHPAFGDLVEDAVGPDGLRQRRLDFERRALGQDPQRSFHHARVRPGRRQVRTPLGRGKRAARLDQRPDVLPLGGGKRRHRHAVPGVARPRSSSWASHRRAKLQ
jgi:hypothetical protein